MLHKRPIDFIKKVVPIAAAIVIFLFFVFATIATKNILPLWQYAVGFIILLIVIGWVIFKKASTLQQVGGQSKNYTGLVFLIICILGVTVFGYWIYTGLNEAPDKTCDVKCMMAYKPSGDCRNENNIYVCKGNWSLTILNDKNIRMLKIYPADGFTSLSQNLLVISGPYTFLFSHTYRTCNGKPINRPIYQAQMWYDYGPGRGKLSEYGCVVGGDIYADTAGYQQKQEPLAIGLHFWHAVARNGEDPNAYIGDRWITFTTSNADPQVLFGGNLILSSSLKETKIQKIEVVYL